MRMSILLFDGFTSLDFIGGYDVLSRIPGLDVEFVAKQRGVLAADTRRLGVLAYRDFAEVRDTDILFVPGGPGGYPLEHDATFLEYIRTLDRTSKWTVGICNGAGLLAAAGLLKGRKATTNWFDRERITQYGVEFVAKRYHRDGKYVTGAGVSASIDTGLYLASILAGEHVAKTIQLGIEYYPAPPFPEKTPAEAPAFAVEIVQQYEAGGGAELLKAKPPFHGTIQVL